MQGRGDERQLVEQFAPLVGYVLSKTGINKSHLYYHDYQQELFIKLLMIARSYEGNPLGAERYKFTAYAKQGLTWHLIEQLRKNQRQVSREVLLEEEPQPVGSIDSQSARIELLEVLNLLEEKLSEEEWKIVMWRYFNEGSMAELAQQMQINRRTLYRKWDKVKDKLQKLLEDR